MSESKTEKDKLSALLEAGWDIAGYSVCMTSMGSLAHNILLKSENNIESITIVTSHGKEDGRSHSVFVPPPEKKKGWF